MPLIGERPELDLKTVVYGTDFSIFSQNAGLYAAFLAGHFSTVLMVSRPLWPRVPGIAAHQLAADLRIQPLPESCEIGSGLHRPLIRRQQVDHHRVSAPAQSAAFPACQRNPASGRRSRAACRLRSELSSAAHSAIECAWARSRSSLRATIFCSSNGHRFAAAFFNFVEASQPQAQAFQGLWNVRRLEAGELNPRHELIKRLLIDKAIDARFQCFLRQQLGCGLRVRMPLLAIPVSPARHTAARSRLRLAHLARFHSTPDFSRTFSGNNSISHSGSMRAVIRINGSGLSLRSSASTATMNS